MEESDEYDASVGVGQGSALSPVLSGLALAPVMNVFEERARAEGIDVSLLSFVDDGLLIAQGREWADVDRKMTTAYQVVHELLSRSGLVLEHNKTELF